MLFERKRIMNGTHLQPYNLAHHRLAHIVVFVVAMLSLGMQSHNARAAQPVAVDDRIGAVVISFDRTTNSGVVAERRPPRRLRSQYFESAIDTLGTHGETRAFVSLRPVRQLSIHTDRPSLTFGFIRFGHN